VYRQIVIQTAVYMDRICFVLFVYLFVCLFMLFVCVVCLFVCAVCVACLFLCSSARVYLYGFTSHPPTPPPHPPPVIKHFLHDLKTHGKYKGFCNLGVSWQMIDNPGMRRSLKLEGIKGNVGILVTKVGL
jgi:hypothetical protein